MPDPLTSAMWSSWVEINPATAARLGIAQGDVVEGASAHGMVRSPAMVSPGIAPDLIAMPAGQGHRTFTRYASGRGENPVDLLAPLTEAATSAPAWAATRVKITRVGAPDGRLVLFAGGMREHEERDVRTCRRKPRRTRRSRRTRIDPKDPSCPSRSSCPSWLMRGSTMPRWGMTADLDRCTGCGACVTACHAENNISTVGADQASRGRAKHWIRVERYWEGDFPDVRLKFRPVMSTVRQRALRACSQHTHPPHAEVSRAFLNRCIGTRYCSNACLQREFFDFFNPSWDKPLTQLNPSALREVGCENCTFCVQASRRRHSIAGESRVKAARVKCWRRPARHVPGVRRPRILKASSRLSRFH